MHQIFLSKQVLEQLEDEVAVTDSSLNHATRDLTLSKVTWALHAFKHMMKTVDLIAVRHKLGYTRAFTYSQRQKEAIAEIMGVGGRDHGHGYCREQS